MIYLLRKSHADEPEGYSIDEDKALLEAERLNRIEWDKYRAEFEKKYPQQGAYKPFEEFSGPYYVEKVDKLK
ncbi:MAG: hypothetical protein PHW03_05230 [Eubacteriales bacterium]|nr:hypothetical protein [Eubacteriales bacterium]